MTRTRQVYHGPELLAEAAKGLLKRAISRKRWAGFTQDECQHINTALWVASQHYEHGAHYLGTEAAKPFRESLEAWRILRNDLEAGPLS